MTFNAGLFLGYQLKFAGSLVASRHVSNQMLKFAARHNIKPQIEEYPMVRVTENRPSGKFRQLAKKEGTLGRSPT
jgi:D-arabinose 1-dehydrogenase-like Zn-dependent alcohol dehydrogenase